MNDDKCTFCGDYPESTLHLLIECHYSTELWNSIFKYIEEISGVLIVPTKAEIILGVIENDLSNFYNNIMIIGKQYIYASRCLHKRPCIQVLIQKIRLERKLQYMSAVQNGKLNHWTNKWFLLEDLPID